MGGKQKRASTFSYEEHNGMTSFSKRHYYHGKNFPNITEVLIKS